LQTALVQSARKAVRSLSVKEQHHF